MRVVKTLAVRYYVFYCTQCVLCDEQLKMLGIYQAGALTINEVLLGM